MDPVRCAEPREPADLEAARHDGGDLAERARTHRLLRCFVDDPVLYLDDLAEKDRAYFVAQRRRLERIAEDHTGCKWSAAARGTALVARARERTDGPFPAAGEVRQLALLLVAALCEAQLHS